MEWLEKFVEESNRIEGIHYVTQDVLDSHAAFLALPELKITDLVDFVAVNAPGHVLRDKPSVPGVRVGSHIAPPSGPHIVDQLEKLLLPVNGHPFEMHVAYENLHPFTDGNGRSGRALWLWMMRNKGGRDKRMAEQLGFLHAFYYQTLSASNARRVA